ncbi:Tlg2-vesicle protein [Yamadazyma tenuis]|uniref:Tlg2-vesicle protein n=1 Tax=Candida tenuis TaxID=2315449 RepID=UPI0027A2ABD4|nr:Tlg2-vesicle protein [Yamadazyma tenuis]
MPSIDNYASEPSLADRVRSVGTKYLKLCQKGLDWYKQQTRIKQVLISFAAIIAVALMGALAIFHVYIIKFLIELSDKLAEWKYGPLLLFTLVFFVGFPPLLGFSSLSLLTGMTLDIIPGWALLSTSSITGSFVSFLVYRHLLSDKSHQLLQSNETFKVFAETIRQDNSLLLLVLIRLCPLPYSLSNGALAAIPELSASTYLLASVVTSPKLFAHIFVGHQLKDIGDESNSTTRRVVDGVTVLVTGLASALTTYIIYHKMQIRLHKHRNSEPNGDYNEIIFGDFGDDESGNNLELNSADFDADNFIIDDDNESQVELQSVKANSKSQSPVDPFGDEAGELDTFEVDNTELEAPKSSPSKPGYRDY